MVNFICQFAWAAGYPDRLQNIISMCVCVCVRDRYMEKGERVMDRVFQAVGTGYAKAQRLEEVR